MPTNSTAPPGAIYEKDAKGIAQKYYKSQKGMPVEDEYLEKIWNKIMEQKPHSISTNKPLRVAVRVFMNENGDVKNVMFREPSGNDRFDAELVRTIYKIGSFGKLPKYLVKKARTTGFIFEFKF
ncbi:MAG: hypothetical protein A3F82_04680 [Deltaproteobacteria bacterium RIFCSPLOWO2_12_FULL_44_12]|nr:MAG: hypothetical protein A2712_00435 [Deltaproteobacteria bacterium RIFCSPHIGHO2_01_FULL_43_49]OGQ14258.1 MAG: hypothetical protein A3D22_10180 [Deltaproteobacteria bacterium RIFCSPHIGHO2_02_FULL_44_53]OGQ27474.1 MAG: hypothetical protein A3D98_03780 [Deltaproteobacteria bacterium RIFCSPHIGHO2_12_FULL_44_21]OGQ30722.1 MAG: hypothetical protein A2979_06205 [Deltaproteobacteria bacterium RIFCSPLOWO2_01_FULL_45_74]OGQ42399.1 MAG: hypothetical protein A3I70_02690 [Deltaproteobacteria bacterium 